MRMPHCAYASPNYWDTKYSWRLTLNELKDGVIFCEIGSRLHYLGPRTAIELFRQDLLAFITCRLLFSILLVEY